jgi:hypothetical protein
VTFRNRCDVLEIAATTGCEWRRQLILADVN